MSYKIDTVQSRSKLAPRRAPYWQRISTGCHVGYRKLSATSMGTWLHQTYDVATKKQKRESIGALSGFPAHKQFDEAKRLAEAKHKHFSHGGSAEVISVKGACERYVTSKELANKPDQAKELKDRYVRHVYSTDIARIELTKLTHRHVDSWRNNLMKTPVVKNRLSNDPTLDERSPSSVNRDMTALRAALNFALENRLVTSDFAWRSALKPIKNADKRRSDYLDKNERCELIGNADKEIAIFLKGLSLLPLRPGALAKLTISEYDKKLQVLTIGRDKTGVERKIKLPNSTAKFLSSLVTNLSENTIHKSFIESSELNKQSRTIFRRKDGSGWNKDSWKKPIKTAAAAANLSTTVTAYTIRHSVITDLIVEAKLDLLTVAQLSGTSVAMIEKHYGHLRLDHAAKALDSLSI